MKVEQISQGKGFVGVVVDLKCTNKIPIVKVMEQIQKKTYLQNSNLKDDVGIIVINKLYNQRFNFLSYYHWIQKLVCTNYKIILKQKGANFNNSHEPHFIIHSNNLHK
jgi:hypothetical protein